MPCNTYIQSLSPYRRAVVLTWAAFAVLTLIFVIVFCAILEEGVWSGYDSRPCENYCENSHQCDHNMSERPVIQQPVNAWTNLAYLLVGLWPLVRCGVDVRTVIFCFACAYICLGSFVFHASLTVFWMNMDVAGMFTVLTALVGHGFHVVTGISWRLLAIPVLAVAVAVPLVKKEMYKAGLGSDTWFKGSIILILILDLILVVARGRRIIQDIDRSRTRRAKASEMARVVFTASLPLAMFALAVMIRSRDVSKEWCNPDSIIQGHGVWHILTAMAIHIIWRFFDRNRLAELLTPSRDSEDNNEQVEKGVAEEGGT